MTQCVFISQFLKRKYPPSFLRNIFLTICRSVCARCVLLRFNDFSSFWKSWLYDFRRIFEMSLESWIVSRDHIFFPYRHISSKKLTKGSHKRREVTLQEYMVFEIKQIKTRSSKQQLTFFFFLAMRALAGLQAGPGVSVFSCPKHKWHLSWKSAPV